MAGDERRKGVQAAAKRPIHKQKGIRKTVVWEQGSHREAC